MPTPLECLMFNIARWEGLFQAMAADPGNWVGNRLLGTMRGVTPAVLAAHRGVPVTSLTVDDMKSVSALEAGEIGKSKFYDGTGLDRLLWCAATDVLVDFGWGSGPGQAVKSCERMLGIASPDYHIGDDTIAAWSNAIKAAGVETMVMRLCDMRVAFYELICQRNHNLYQFLTGWKNRARWMTPGGEWWAHWQSNDPTQAIASAEAAPSNPMPMLLSMGMQGGDVAKLQAALKRALSGLHLAIDGRFGPATDAAVRNYQCANGLQVDGWVGPATRAKLGMP